jgi:hypothetical protein
MNVAMLLNEKAVVCLNRFPRHTGALRGFYAQFLFAPTAVSTATTHSGIKVSRVLSSALDAGVSPDTETKHVPAGPNADGSTHCEARQSHRRTHEAPPEVSPECMRPRSAETQSWCGLVMRDASLKVAWGEEDQVLWIMINRRKESEGLPPGSAFSQQESVT